MTPTEFRSARKALDLTQDQVARVLGVSPPTIRKWEAGPNCSTSTKVNGAAAVYMAALNLTQTQAAPLWGVSLSTLQRWVRAPELASAAPVPGKAATLMAAYLAGFRPDGWPVGRE